MLKILLQTAEISSGSSAAIDWAEVLNLNLASTIELEIF
jgi:hypothetical protein